MQALSPEEFRAVLAHEIGHLSGNHGRITWWIYRIRNTWMQLLQRLEQERRWGSVVFTKFFAWYAPLLNAYSFVLARSHEYEADRCAAEIAGRETAARALMAVDLRGKFLNDEFWPELWKAARETDQPPMETYSRQRLALRNGFSPLQAGRWAANAIAVKTGYGDTHPSLCDRLASLGVNVADRDALAAWAAGIEIPGKSAADEFLGSTLDWFHRKMDERWRGAAEPAWKAFYKQMQQEREQLRELREKQSQGPLTEEEDWTMATLVQNLEGNEAAIPLLRDIVTRNPRHVSANYELGRLLLSQDDLSGLELLDRASEDDPRCTIGVCLAAEDFLRRRDRIQDADRYHQRAIEFSDLCEQAEKERQNATAADRYVEHGLDDDAIQEVKRQLPKYTHLKAAFLARKVVKIFPESPAFVFGIVPVRRWYRLHDGKADLELLNRVAAEVSFPEQAFIFLLNDDNARLRKKLQAVRGARIYGD
jgi:hypothetical protein